MSSDQVSEQTHQVSGKLSDGDEELHPHHTDINNFSLLDQLDGNISMLSSRLSLPFPQFDGNISLELSYISENDAIPSQIGNRPPKVIYERPPHSRKTIRRDNREIVAQFLPKITSYNVRSLMPKICNAAQDIIERESDLIFLTEIWEKEDDKKHQHRIEELLELDGIKYISTPRPGKRGGGAALAVRLENYTISKLNIAIPRPVEVVWGLLRPNIPNMKIKTIIACCFFSPPRSKKNRVLIDHMTVTLQALLTTHSIIISGDRNNIDIPVLLSIDPSDSYEA